MPGTNVEKRNMPGAISCVSVCMRAASFERFTSYSMEIPVTGRKSVRLTGPISCNIVSYMRHDTRLSDVLHVLLHMAQHEGPLTSEALAGAMGTNPVVVRRTLAGLRDRGYVRSEKGHGGGWVVARSLSDITL